MLVNKYEIEKALAACKEDDKEGRNLAILKQISEEFTDIRNEFDKKEQKKQEAKNKEENLRKALREYDKDLTDAQITNTINYMKNKPVDYKVEYKNLTKDELDAYTSYIDRLINRWFN